jgi:hypothetical protein
MIGDWTSNIVCGRQVPPRQGPIRSKIVIIFSGSYEQDRPLVQRFHEIDHMAANIHFVIPGRRSEAQANPESSSPQQ